MAMPMLIKTLYYLTKALAIVAVLAWLDPGAGGQETLEKPRHPAIRTTGEATVTVKPDQAHIDIGVVTQAEGAQRAAAENAKKLESMLSELRKVLGPEADIKTISYALTPVYRYPKEGGTPTVTGYSATNVVQVKTHDLMQVGKIIDTATQSKANSIQGLRFGLKDEQGVYAQALREAAARARGKAEAIASALGLRIVRVLVAEEGGKPTRPVYAAAMPARAGPAPVQTPVEPGTLEVHATVTLTVEIAL